jgi:hypothetical protein
MKSVVGDGQQGNCSGLARLPAVLAVIYTFRLPQGI